MIWSLAKEQLRSQWRYILSAAVVITVAVGLAAYAGVMAVTLSHSQHSVDRLLGVDRDSFADASTDSLTEFSALAPQIDAANAAGHNVVAQSPAWPTLPSQTSHAYDPLIALYGDVDWSDMLVEGAAPAPGEVAVSAQWAQEEGVGVGDIVLPTAGQSLYDDTTIPVDFPLRVSGITRSAIGTAGVELYVPIGWVSWEDIPQLNRAWATAVNGDSPDSGSVVQDIIYVTIYGDGNWPWSTDLATQSSPGGGTSSPVAGLASVVGVAFGALVLGLIAMAFALGRAQAHARTKWVGTVRAMGASKRHVVSATLLESLIVGVAAGATGFVVGAAGAVAHCWLIASRVASPMLLPAATGYVGVACATVLLAVVLTLIVGAVPAFWSTRVEPTAALKPVTDLAQATVSRSVRVWPLAVTWFIAAAVSASGFATSKFSGYAIVVLLAVVVLAVTTVMLAHEVLRHTIPWHAERMSRSRRRAVMVAGDAILARPRQSTIPAFIVALSTTVVVSILGELVAAWSAEQDMYVVDAFGDPVAVSNPYLALLPLLGIYAVVTLLCVAVALATATVTVREAATRDALGLTVAQGRIATALQYLVGQLHGLGLGLIGGAVGVTVAMSMGMGRPMQYNYSWWSPVMQFFGLTVLVVAASALVGAAISTALAPKTAPLSRVEVSA